MTTADPFTEAARAEAERQNPVPTAYQPNGPSQWERLLAQEAFRNGAEWARDHLAAQEPSDEEVALIAAHLENRIPPDSLEGIVREVLITARRVPTLRAARRDGEKR